MSSLEKVSEELRQMGHSPETLQFSGTPAHAVVIDWPVENGRYKGSVFRLGIGFQEEGYPDYPPHFLLIEGLESPNIPEHSKASCDNGVWSVFSVPPNDFWDRLPSEGKNMRSYLRLHVARFWSQI